MAEIKKKIQELLKEKEVKVEQTENSTVSYEEYKKNEQAKEKEFDFAEIEKAKAEEEKKVAEESTVDIFKLDDELNDDELEKIEDRLKTAAEKGEDDVDLDAILKDINTTVLEETNEAEAGETVEMDETLKSYSIDKAMEELDKDDEVEDSDAELTKLLQDLENLEDEIEETEKVEEVLEEKDEEVKVEETKEEIVEEVKEETATEEVETEEVVTEDVEVETEDEDDDDEDKGETIELEEKDEEVEIVEEVKEEKAEDEVSAEKQEIERLKKQLEEMNRQLEEARSSKLEVVTIDATEEDCLARLAVLEERLKNAKRDYKINMKEYRPLKKVMADYERYQTKLRRKDAIVAKKKVALYGVNNYVDIDKEKAEKLANDLELLDGLRLSVSHCEEVINANKDRFPVLQHTNKILEEQIAHIESDIALTQATLEKIRNKK